MSIHSLDQLGWRAFYSQQLTLDDLDRAWPARVVNVHRGVIVVYGESGEHSVTLPGHAAADALAQVTTGDWVLVEHGVPRVARILERASLISRLAAGTQLRPQTIAANVDTLFIVTSCNEDFNPSRLERYLSVAMEARIDPVIVLTKTDLCANVPHYVEQAERVAPQVSTVAVSAIRDETKRLLAPWLGAGQTVAFVGSSGVGKSTLINTLSGAGTLATGAIRDDDAKGRHTTTSRQLVAMTGGAWLLDTPGMRELKVGAVEAGVRAVFTEIEVLARDCRFRNCTHQGDAGCAISKAIADGSLDARRFSSYLKLQREAANASRTVAERRERDRQFGRMHKALQERHRRDKRE